MEKISVMFQKLAAHLGLLLFPSVPKLREIETMRPQEFLERASRPIDELPGVISLFDYDDPLVRQAVKALKYEGNCMIADIFAAVLYDVILEELAEEKLFSNFTNPILVPVALSRERLKERGWNQSELIAKRIGQLDRNINFEIRTDILKKIRHTVSQTKLDRSKRLKNLAGCFEASSVCSGRNIILLDDVATTGSTIEEAEKALKSAGARRVIAFTIAH